MQSLALAFGECLAYEHFYSITRSQSLDANVKQVFEKLLVVYALDIVKLNGLFLLTHGFLNTNQSQQVQVEIEKICMELGEKALLLTKSFGVPEHLHFAPIAHDWVKYNETNNFGELSEDLIRAIRSKL